MRFLNFSFRQAFQGLWRNRVMNLAATVTMVLMLVLLATLTIVISGMEAGLTFIESKVEVRAELLDGVPAERVADLQRELEERPDVASTSYISKEDARAEFSAARSAAGQDDLTSYLSFNPFPAQVAVKLVDPREAKRSPRSSTRETAVVERVNDGQTGIDRLVGITGDPAHDRRRRARLRRAHGAAHRHQQHPDGAHVARPGDRDHAPRRRLRPLRALAVHRRRAAHRRHRAGVTLLLLLLASAPISDLARAIAGQVPVGFSESLTTQSEPPGRRRWTRARRARRLDQRARLPAKLIAVGRDQ